MDQKALDDAYDQIVYAPNRPFVQARRDAATARARKAIAAPIRCAYGESEIEKLDIYRTLSNGAPVMIYIHGGAWRSGSATKYPFLAEMFIKAGVHCVIPDFINIDAASGNLMTMVTQVRRAVAWTFKSANLFGGDPNRIFVSGHSSGGHLAGCVVTTDWQKDFNLPPDVVKGGLLASGMYDLKAVRLSKRSKYVTFTDEIEYELSAQRHIDRLNCPVIVAYGTCETPEFQRQARDFAAAVQQAGKPVNLIVGEGYNHFELTETLGNPYGLLGRAVVDMIWGGWDAN